MALDRYSRSPVVHSPEVLVRKQTFLRRFAALAGALVVACLPPATESGVAPGSANAGAMLVGQAGAIAMGGASAGGMGGIEGVESAAGGTAGAASGMTSAEMIGRAEGMASPDPGVENAVELDGVRVVLGGAFLLPDMLPAQGFVSLVHEPSGAFALLEVAQGSEAQLLELMSAPYPLTGGGSAGLVTGPTQTQGYYVATYSSAPAGDIVVYGRAEAGRILILSGQNVGSLAADLAQAMMTATFS